MKNEVKFLFSQLGLNQPIEVFIEEPAMGELYMRGRYVRFKAHIDIVGKLRQFNLNLPKNVVYRAFGAMPVRDKNCKLLKVILQKEEKGRLNIIEWERIK